MTIMFESRHERILIVNAKFLIRNTPWTLNIVFPTPEAPRMKTSFISRNINTKRRKCHFLYFHIFQKDIYGKFEFSKTSSAHNSPMTPIISLPEEMVGVNLDGLSFIMKIRTTFGHARSQFVHAQIVMFLSICLLFCKNLKSPHFLIWLLWRDAQQSEKQF